MKKATGKTAILIGALVAAFLAIYMAYRFFSPMPFLLLSAILLAVFYYSLNYSSAKVPLLSLKDSHPAVDRSRKLSVLFLTLLFFISITAMRDYQMPNGSNPYFSNSDHYAVQNEGVAFNHQIELYSDDSKSTSGIWASDGGSLSVVASGKTTELAFDNFYYPVFATKKGEKKTRTSLINPIYTEIFRSGFTISDRRNSLAFIKVELAPDELPQNFIHKNTSVYNLDIVFTSDDPEILSGDSDVHEVDTLSLKKITLRKGLDIRDIIYKDKGLDSSKNTAPVLNWLNRYKRLQVLTTEDTITGVSSLRFFASEDFIDSGKVHLDNKPLVPSPVRGVRKILSENQGFYVGLGNQRNEYRVVPVGDIAIFRSQPVTHIIKFEKLAYCKLTDFSEGREKFGKEELRFINNNYKNLQEHKLRDGLLFNDDSKANDYTNLKETLLKFTNGKPCDKLQWELWANASDIGYEKNGGKQFFIKSNNERLLWIYAFRDFSGNKYAPAKMNLYMGLLMTAILFLVIFYPGKSVLPIETPVWMIVYVMMIFRLLLLWRIATFPALDNISKDELDTLISFDVEFQHLPVPLFPFSMWLFLIVILAIIIIRKRRSNVTSKKLPPPKKRLSLETRYILAMTVLALIVLASIVLRIEILTRVSKILAPLTCYFYFVHQAIRKKARYQYDEAKKTKYGKWLLTRVLMHWIETPVFLFSLTTFVFLALTDRGFAVMFLVFLLIKNIFLNLSLPVKKYQPVRIGRIRIQPENYRIFGLIALTLFLITISMKSLAFVMLGYRQYLLLGIILLAVYGVYTIVLQKRKRLASVALGFLLLASTCILLPKTWNWIDKKIDNSIRAVKFRTTMLYKPMTEVLLKEKYKSGAETKIIETGQGQWFIHNYLDTSTFVVDEREISFKPDFNKGVDYSTQTRDVVLARFVIPEFGVFTMTLLLILLSLPLVFFFLAYRIQDNGVFDANSILAAMAVLLLFSSVLIVWMASTNRFIFFGQDFPFLSITSRISTMIPLLLVLILLIMKPLQRNSSNIPQTLRAVYLFLFFVLIVFTISISGKSHLLDEKNFKPDFSRIETRINTDIDDYFLDAQSKDVRLNDNISHRELLFHIAKWMNSMKADPGYTQMLDSLSVYEVSMLEELRKQPAMGTDERSPIHVIRENHEYHLRFNPYFHFELPAYNNKKIWKGDIYEKRPGYPERANIGNAEIQIVPETYLPAGGKTHGLLDMIRGGDMRIYQLSTKKLERYVANDPVIKLTEDDILFYRENNKSMFKTWSVSDERRHYFVYNLRINGHQRMIYPLGKDFFWIRQWAEANKIQFEKKQGVYLDSSTTINLDYELTKNVGSYLSTTLRSVLAQKITNTKNVIFSVIASDGDGRIRLMSDQAMQRLSLDPNSEHEISEKLKDEYFKRDNEAARLQWGNTNLLHMRLGPGSSIKPLVLAAVASQKKMEWDKLMYMEQNMPADPNPKHSDAFIVDNYAGLQLPNKRGAWSEPNHNNKNTNLITYLAKSNNIYHSLIVFLGSYKNIDFEKNGSLKNQLRQYTTGFPKMSLGDGAMYAFKDSMGWPQAQDPKKYFGNNASMLAAGLNENMALQTYSGLSSGEFSQRYNYSKMEDDMPYKSIWSFPEKSYFDQKERTGTTIIANFNNGLRQTTLGGAVFRLTPLQVMEMYGKMFYYDKEFSVSIDSASPAPAKWVNIDPDWKDDYPDFLEKQVFEGMREVITNGTGTYLGELRTAFPQYNFLAKTGTIGSSSSDNSKRLIVVITMKRQKKVIEERKKYFIYFTLQNAYIEKDGFSDKGWFQTYFKNIIRQIIDSKTFKNYMN